MFGDVGGDLLVGNFSSGQIDAYNVTLSPSEASGQFLGRLLNKNGTPLTIPGLRSIHFGPGLGDSGSTHVGLLFTAEISIPFTNAFANWNISLYGEITPASVPLPPVVPVVPPGQPCVLFGNGSGVPLVDPPGGATQYAAALGATGNTTIVSGGTTSVGSATPLLVTAAGAGGQLVADLGSLDTLFELLDSDSDAFQLG